MLRNLLQLNGSQKFLELENIEKMLQTSLHEVEPRSGYEYNLRRRLDDYSRTIPVSSPAHNIQNVPTVNEALLMLLGFLSGAAVLVMGIRVAVLTIAGFGLLRGMRREIQDKRWQSPRPAN